MIRSLIFNVLFYSFTFIIALICWDVAKVSTRIALWHVVRFWGRCFLLMLRVIMGSRVEVRGADQGKGRIGRRAKGTIQPVFPEYHLVMVAAAVAVLWTVKDGRSCVKDHQGEGLVVGQGYRDLGMGGC